MDCENVKHIESKKHSKEGKEEKHSKKGKLMKSNIIWIDRNAFSYSQLYREIASAFQLLFAAGR